MRANRCPADDKQIGRDVSVVVRSGAQRRKSSRRFSFSEGCPTICPNGEPEQPPKRVKAVGADLVLLADGADRLARRQRINRLVLIFSKRSRLEPHYPKVGNG
jgi:hypothetical protein